MHPWLQWVAPQLRAARAHDVPDPLRSWVATTPIAPRMVPIGDA